MSRNDVRDTSASGSFDVVIERDVAVPMRDGIVLRADVYRPGRGGDGLEEQLSTVLVRTSSLLVPGETHTLRIRMHPTGNLFNAGHRLRIQIASSDYAAYDVNPGTGGTLMAPNGPPLVAQNTIFHDARRASHVVLPVIP